MEIDPMALFGAALSAAQSAYAPYSHFRVGAALLCADGHLQPGVNVENRSYGLTICAERSAIVAAISQGHGGFLALALATPDSDYPVPPCGACRQVLSEFAGAEFPIFYGPDPQRMERHSLGQLYPFDSLHELGRA